MNSELDSFVNFPKLTNKTTDGTSYHGINITTTIKKLTNLLGKPNAGSCQKVDSCWNCELVTGEVFTIYDWKCIRPIKIDELYGFHIGGFNREDTIKAQRLLLKVLENYNG